MFVPDYSHFDELLIPDGNQQLNDLYLARHAKSQELSELYMSSSKNNNSQDAPAILDYSDIDDNTLFDICLDKSIQSPSEFQQNFKEFRL